MAGQKNRANAPVNSAFDQTPDVETILRKHGGFDIPIPGFSMFNRAMSRDLEKQGRDGEIALDYKDKYKAIWKEISKYVQEKQYDGLVTKIILQDKWK